MHSYQTKNDVLFIANGDWSGAIRLVIERWRFDMSADTGSPNDKIAVDIPFEDLMQILALWKLTTTMQRLEALDISDPDQVAAFLNGS